LYILDQLYGFGILTIKNMDMHKSLFAIYYDGCWNLDLFWFRVLSS